MTYKRLKEKARPHFYSLSIDKFFPKKIRSILRKGSALLAILSFVLSFDSLPLYFGSADGMFFLFIFVYLLLSFLEFFYRSMIGEDIDFALSSILFQTDDIDVVRSLFETKIGEKILLRTGISKNDFQNFIYSDRMHTFGSSLDLAGDFVDLSSYMATVYDADKSFATFLSSNSIGADEFLGAVSWVSKTEDRKRLKERFWSRENLGAIPSIGTSWSYGVAVDLGRYGVPFENSLDISVLDIDNGYREKEVSTLENILEKRSEANVIIVDDDERVARDITGRLLKRMKLGISPPNIEHKNIIELDYNALFASYKEKSELEGEILKILNQSVLAGNVLLYINDLSNFVTSLKPLGINLPSLLAPYLSSGSLQIISHTTVSDFHFFIETNPTLLEKFERLIPEKAGLEASLSALLEQAPKLENEFGVIFSYPSMLSLVSLSNRFVTYGEMPGKALNLLAEIAPWALSHNIYLIKEEDVATFVSEKTGIAGGPIKEKEAQKIEHLEEILHRRVVGQEEAVSGIASAIRRSRSGMVNPERPLTSFLFIGPTGVGKTEVSKALAESFFGDENKMIRFDMSEFNGPSASARLLGDFNSNKSGILATKIRDNPYSVLLLDEFEKAAPDVLDLFLQILDEGVFTDALGKQVGCRNLIIIATSNAGSDLIWEAIKSKKDLSREKENIVNQIIKEKIFKPELLNRFDGLILFHPLENEELRSVAKLELEKLKGRLKDQNMEFVINDEVINFVAEKGSDPQFGARSINRIIKDKVEDLIARKIISGALKPGTKIELNKDELI